MIDPIAKPPPVPSADLEKNIWTAPFWEAASRHQLVLPKCSHCGHFRMPPTPFCPRCRSQGIDWSNAPDRAMLFSYTIVERAITPGLTELPYVPAIVEFPEADHVRLITNIVGSRLSQIKVGEPVDLAWLDLPSGLSLPVFAMTETS